MVAHHAKGWESIVPGWKGEVVEVDFDLLSTFDLNQRGMRGSDQYYLDPIPRATNYIYKYQGQIEAITKIAVA